MEPQDGLQKLPGAGAHVHIATLFQCLYQPAPAHWAMLPSTLEWHVLILAIAAAGFAWPAALAVAAVGWLMSAVVAGLQAAQAKFAPKHEGWASRAVIAALC